MVWMKACSLILAVGILASCGTIDEISQQIPSGSQCTFTCPSGEVLASETTLGSCTFYVVDKMCVGTKSLEGCEGDPKGYKVLLQNQSGAVVVLRNEALQKGEWEAKWGERREIRAYGSYDWGIAETHGSGVRFVCP